MNSGPLLLTFLCKKNPIIYVGLLDQDLAFYRAIIVRLCEDIILLTFLRGEGVIIR